MWYTYAASCYLGTLAYASHCMLDVSDNNRPMVGYITMCLSVRYYYYICHCDYNYDNNLELG